MGNVVSPPPTVCLSSASIVEFVQPRPQGLLRFVQIQNGGSVGGDPDQGCQKTPKILACFVVWIAGNNLKKRQFILCHVTKYSTILGVEYFVSLVLNRDQST